MPHTDSPPPSDARSAYIEGRRAGLLAAADRLEGIASAQGMFCPHARGGA